MKKQIQIDPLMAEMTDNIFALKDLDHPADLMERALEDVNKAFETLYENYNMSYDEFYTYIQFYNDGLSREIDELWDRIDSDIYDHYEQGTLLSFELNTWKSELIEWKENILAAIRDIIKAEYYDELHTDSTGIAYGEAA
ncbi:hypothetical protein EH223_05505 [candidate division KSB1 bacterium]|nr:hypothetical protein [candidate division KSB1 bacterium]RQW05218.1 MAG: hypothetical protein EH223_05505 [candidate division KSB1 bacterium]